jgi:hypothetical protein
VWRGLLLGGSAPSLQPGFNFSWEGFSVGTWGAFSDNALTIQELDLYVSYTFWKEMFTVSVYDYCFPNEANADFKYFDYRNASTSHLFEAGIKYNGIEKIPISAAFYMNFYGADAKNKRGNNLLSSYAEIAYNPTIKKIGVNLSLFVGAALNGQSYMTNDSVEGPLEHRGFYGNEGFAVVNVGLSVKKVFSLKKILFPVGASLIFNPNANKAYLVGSVGISL